MKTPDSEYPYEEEYSFRKALKKRLDDVSYLWTKKFMIILAGIIGMALGLVIALNSKVSYTSRVTFVIDDTKGAAGGGMVSALAGQLGLDFGSIGGASGVLAGDNVQQLLKSESIVKQSLLTPYDSVYTLADKYAEVGKLSDQWKKYNNGKIVLFPANRRSYTRLQDSLLQDIALRAIKNNFSISKPDKKLSFFEASSTMLDEKLAQLFCTRLINTATRFYIDTRTKKLRDNVSRLQRRSDSLTRVLNRKTYSASSANKLLLDANPAYPTVNVGPELQERDKMVLSTIYSEVVKNLEASKTMLDQETPTIQIVDVSEYPLKKNKIKYVKLAVLWGMGVAAAMMLFLLIKRGL